MEPEAGTQRSDVIALPNEPLKLTAAGYCRAYGAARHESWKQPARPQLAGDPLGSARP